MTKRTDFDSRWDGEGTQKKEKDEESERNAGGVGTEKVSESAVCIALALGLLETIVQNKCKRAPVPSLVVQFSVLKLPKVRLSTLNVNITYRMIDMICRI